MIASLFFLPIKKIFMKTDAEIKKDVTDALKRNVILGSCDINVDVVCGTVYLSGKVDSYHKKFEAGEIVKKIEYVKKVHSDIYVVLPQEAKRTDAQIKDEIESIFHTSLPENNILVRVYDGIVVLTGATDNEQQQMSASKAILDVTGIQNIWYFIHVKTKMPAINYQLKKNTTTTPDKNYEMHKAKLRLEELAAV